MKPVRLLFLLPLLAFAGCDKPAKSSIPSTPLAYNLETTVGAYEKVGSRKSAWNNDAKDCLRMFAEIRSDTNRPPAEAITALRAQLSKVASLKCDDPMLRYLEARYLLSESNSAAELVPIYAGISDALDKSRYPAIRRFYARMWVYRNAAHAGGHGDLNELLENAAACANEALQDQSIPEAEASTVCEELLTQPSWSEEVRWNCYGKIEPALAGRWKDSSFARLAKGRGYLTYAWLARGTGFANTVSEQAWKQMRERLDVAAAELEKAWELNPNDPSICLEMMRVELGQGKGLDRLNMWFDRGMKLNPRSWNICEAKLGYLSPRWYGTAQQTIEFGRQCMTNEAWSGEVRLGLVNAHYQMAREMPDREHMYGYLADSNVWADIRSNFESFFKLYPEETSYRHNYAQFARYAADWDEFLRQVKMFPSTNFAYFGGVERFNSFLQLAQQHADAKR